MHVPVFHDTARCARGVSFVLVFFKALGHETSQPRISMDFWQLQRAQPPDSYSRHGLKSIVVGPRVTTVTHIKSQVCFKKLLNHQVIIRSGNLTPQVEITKCETGIKCEKNVTLTNETDT